MATENQGWDTSTAHIRRTLEACIEHGRRAGGREGADLWESYRLLGTALHTLEDLLAHSNWCEIALRKMGHSEVFCHVGDSGKYLYWFRYHGGFKLIQQIKCSLKRQTVLRLLWLPVPSAVPISFTPSWERQLS